MPYVSYCLAVWGLVYKGCPYGVGFERMRSHEARFLITSASNLTHSTTHLPHKSHQMWTLGSRLILFTKVSQLGSSSRVRLRAATRHVNWPCIGLGAGQAALPCWAILLVGVLPIGGTTPEHMSVFSHATILLMTYNIGLISRIVFLWFIFGYLVLYNVNITA